MSVLLQLLVPMSIRLSLVTLLLLFVWVAGSVSAQDRWQYPIDVAADESGTIYVADRRLPGVWKFVDGEWSILVRGSNQFRTPLNAIRCVSVARDGSIFVGDSATREVYRVSSEGELTPLTDGFIGIPMDIADDSQGRLYVTDTELHRVWRVPAEGGEPEEFAVLAGPRGIAVDEEDHVWVLSLQAPQLRRYAPDGTQTVIVADLTFEFPHQLLLREQDVLVSDGYGKCVWSVPRDGGAPKQWVSGEPFGNPVGLARRGEEILVVDPRSPDPGGGLLSISPDGMVNRVYPPDP